MTLSDLLLWYNIGYAGTFLLGLFFLATSLFGGDGSGSEQDTEVEAHHEVDPDADADHELQENGLSVKSHETSDLSHSSALQSFLIALGVGKCPFSVIIMILLFLFTFIGISANAILKSVLANTPAYGLLTYGFSLLASFFLTGRIARLLGNLMPSQETYISKESALVGKIGKSVYTFTDAKGYVQVYVNRTLQEVSAVNMEPSENIQAGDDVLFVDYDPEHRVFMVKLAPKELAKS